MKLSALALVTAMGLGAMSIGGCAATTERDELDQQGDLESDSAASAASGGATAGKSPSSAQSTSKETINKFYATPDGTSGRAACGYHTELKLTDKLVATVTEVSEVECEAGGYTLWGAGKRWTDRSHTYQLKRTGTAKTGFVYEGGLLVDNTPSFGEYLKIEVKANGAPGPHVSLTETLPREPSTMYLRADATFLAP